MFSTGDTEAPRGMHPRRAVCSVLLHLDAGSIAGFEDKEKAPIREWRAEALDRWTQRDSGRVISARVPRVPLFSSGNKVFCVLLPTCAEVLARLMSAENKSAPLRAPSFFVLFAQFRCRLQTREFELESKKSPHTQIACRGSRLPPYLSAGYNDPKGQSENLQLHFKGSVAMADLSC